MVPGFAPSLSLGSTDASKLAAELRANTDISTLFSSPFAVGRDSKATAEARSETSKGASDPTETDYVIPALIGVVALGGILATIKIFGK